MVFAFFRAGFAQMFAYKRIVVIFYIANLFFGFILMLPVRQMMGSFIGHSASGGTLAASFDMDFLFEFLKANSAFFSINNLMLVMALILYWLVNMFLSGGALGLFVSDQKYVSSEFWGNSGKFMGRFFRLALMCIPILVILVLFQYLEDLFEWLLFSSDPYQYVIYWGSWIRLSLRYLAFLIFVLVLDYAKIYTVITGEVKMFKALKQGIRFTIKNFRRAFTLTFSFTLLGIIGLLIYNSVSDFFSEPSILIILLMFIFQQLFMMFRMMIRLGLYAGEVKMFTTLTPELIKTPTGRSIIAQGNVLS